MTRNPKTNAGRPRGDQLEIYLAIEAGHRFLKSSVNEFCNKYYKSFDDISRRQENKQGPIRGRTPSGETLRRQYCETKAMLEKYYAGLELPGVRVNLPSPNGRERLEALVVDRMAIWEAESHGEKRIAFNRI
tara:strand:- start:2129 stop:2524 length:396 start_codon:yes stop_codon:yes gene_type:complete